mmetsp:Transcript_20710/g.65140  ORF Transcript_20710/g.65140 Transcript_20710/m.65140 type:complete len:253 (-) Transcript_20710:32-790(-)
MAEMSAFEDPSVTTAVSDLAAAEAFFQDADDFAAEPPAGGGRESLYPTAPATSFGSAPPPPDVPASAFSSGTLDESVADTLLRDVRHVGGKLWLVLRPYASETDTLQHLRDWDLWGPLLVSLALAVSLAAGAPAASAASVFSIVFVVMWVGAVVVTVNAQLLGGTLSFLQSVCVLGYSAFPVCAARFGLVALEGVGGRHVAIRAAVAAAALVWSTRASVLFFTEVIGPARRVLAVYPVVGFYAWLCWMIVVI